MVVFKNDCCDCAVPGYPCIGERCELLHNPHFYCDECEEEVNQGELYWFEDEQLCLDCITKRLKEVTADASIRSI